MSLILQRNSTPDPWFNTHVFYINEGDMVILRHIVNEEMRNKIFPPEIIVECIDSEDDYHHKVSLCCFDYVGSNA